MIAVITFFWFLCGHALADYPLQGPFLSSAKRKGGIADFPWPIALASHGLIHGCMVALVVTGMLFAVTNITTWGILSIAFVIAMLETFCHAVIDYQKCNNKIGIWTDQILHVWCKICWTALLISSLYSC